MTASSQAKLTLTLHLERETAAAVLVRRPDAETAPVWLPLAAIEVAPERAGRRLMITLPRKLAEQKGLLATAGAGQGSLF